MAGARGLSLIEILVAVLLFGALLTPLMVASIHQTSDAYSISHHLLAGIIAESILSSIVAEEFDVARQRIAESGAGDHAVLDSPDFFQKLLSHPKLKDAAGVIAADTGRDLRSFRYRMEYIEPTDQGEKGLMFLVRVTVTWTLRDNIEQTRQEITLEAIKYHETRRE
ncbi:MAG TPA: hypothetical protein PLU72_13295 [Candidatus Ozemobacteraceae bacterium]|nr:hypothetical protein [Candidatus Ozemobacteraceae bacterium]